MPSYRSPAPQDGADDVSVEPATFPPGESADRIDPQVLDLYRQVRGLQHVEGGIPGAELVDLVADFLDRLGLVLPDVLLESGGTVEVADDGAPLVETEAELEAALAGPDALVRLRPRLHTWDIDVPVLDRVPRIVVDHGTSLRVRGRVVVLAQHHAQVEVGDAAQVLAFQDVRVTARGDAVVHASHSCRVDASDATRVWLYGSSTGRFTGQAQVVARDSTMAWARDEARVTAYDFASVHLADDASVHASAGVAVYQHSPDSAVHGGALVPIVDAVTCDALQWCAHHGIAVVDGHVTLYKEIPEAAETTVSVYDDPPHPALFSYPGPSGNCGCERFDAHSCRMHFRPTLEHARRYAPRGPGARTVRVSIDALQVITYDTVLATAAVQEAGFVAYR